MKPSTKIAIAGLLSAAGAVLSALAGEFGGEAPASADAAAAPEAPKPTKPKKEKAAAAPAPEPEPDKKEEPAAEEPTEGGKTYEQLRALIEPFVKAGQGDDVKKIIKKYDPDSTTPSIKTMPAKNHAAFEKDIAALGY